MGEVVNFNCDVEKDNEEPQFQRAESKLVTYVLTREMMDYLNYAHCIYNLPQSIPRLSTHSNLLTIKKLKDCMDEENLHDARKYFNALKPGDYTSINELLSTNPEYLEAMESTGLHENYFPFASRFCFISEFVKGLNGEESYITVPHRNLIRHREMRKGERTNQGLLRLIQGDSKILFPNPNFNGGQM